MQPATYDEPAYLTTERKKKKQNSSTASKRSNEHGLECTLGLADPSSAGYVEATGIATQI